MGVGFISKPKIQLNFSKLKRQSDGKNNTAGTQTTRALMPMQQQSQKELLSICNEIKCENFISDYVSRRDKAVPDKSSMKGDT